MTEALDDISDFEDEAFYGIKPPLQELVLPNFKSAHKENAESILDIIEANLPSELNYRGYIPFQHFTFGFEELELRVKVDLQNTSGPITSHVVSHYLLSRNVIDGIRRALRDIIAEEVRKYENIPTTFESGLIILRLLEETTSFIQDYRRSIRNDALNAKEKYWELSKTNNIRPLLDLELEMKGVDLDSVYGAATHILGKSPADICHEILPGWRILHCENILRNDLRKNFLEYQQNLRKTLMNVKDISELRRCVPYEHRRRQGEGQAAREQLVEYLIKPRITFHGTRRDLVPSIVQHGFLKPGAKHPITKRPLPVYNGSVYGQGIYSSPDPSYAMLYSEGEHRRKIQPSELPGQKLLICAVIMGRSACMNWGDNWFDQSEPYPGADSHVNQSQWAYIVFNSAQILPCYVLHLDWAGKDDDGDDDDDPWWNFIWQQRMKRGGYKEKKVKSPLDEATLPGEKQRKKAQLIAKGQKFFAYGYGPISGKQLVIEDVADADDDEEEYGVYQETRIDAAAANTSVWDTDWGKIFDEPSNDDMWDRRTLEGTTAFDEYAGARKAKVNRKNPRVD